MNDLQRDILASLQEAGEDDVAALANTVLNGSAHPGVLNDFSRALYELIRMELVRVATSRDSATRQWVPLIQQESLQAALTLPSCLSWSDSEGFSDGAVDYPELKLSSQKAGRSPP